MINLKINNQIFIYFFIKITVLLINKSQLIINNIQSIIANYSKWVTCWIFYMYNNVHVICYSLNSLVNCRLFGLIILAFLDTHWPFSQFHLACPRVSTTRRRKGRHRVLFWNYQSQSYKQHAKQVTPSYSAPSRVLLRKEHRVRPQINYLARFITYHTLNQTWRHTGDAHSKPHHCVHVSLLPRQVKAISVI